MPDFTEAELVALRKAYATGIQRVTYEGRTVEYGSASDILSRILLIERRQTAVAAPDRPRVAYVQFCRD